MCFYGSVEFDILSQSGNRSQLFCGDNCCLYLIILVKKQRGNIGVERRVWHVVNVPSRCVSGDAAVTWHVTISQLRYCKWYFNYNFYLLINGTFWFWWKIHSNYYSKHSSNFFMFGLQGIFKCECKLKCSLCTVLISVWFSSAKKNGACSKTDLLYFVFFFYIF